MTYNEYIDNIINTRGRFACGDEYHERHHIILRCMGGTNDETNLIDLYADEHYNAHKLLAEENPTNKGIVYGWWAMSHLKDKNQLGRKKIDASEYAELKKMFRNVLSGDGNPNYGKKMSQEQREQISAAKKGKKLSDEVRAKISKGHMGIKRKKESIEKTIKAHEKPVAQYTKAGEFITIWESASKASRALGICNSNIGKVCKGQVKTAGGFVWKYIGDDEECQVHKR